MMEFTAKYSWFLLKSSRDPATGEYLFEKCGWI